MLARNEVLIKKARRGALAEEWSETSGISDEVFVDALQDAVSELHQFLVDERCEPFSTYKDITVNANTWSYAVPSDAFINTLVYEVWYSADGSEAGFGEPLSASVRREFGMTGYPEDVYISNGLIYPMPAPSSGVLRVRYEKAPDTADIRRGKITTLFGGTLGGFVGEIGVDTNTVPAGTNFNETEFITVVSPRGVVNARNIGIDSYDEATGLFVLEGAITHILEPDEKVQLLDYVCVGPNSTTHLDLPGFCETFLVDYMVTAALQRDSSTDVMELNPELSRKLSKISSLYSQLPGGRFGIPELRGGW